MIESCFITGTDTDAGKTEVTAALLRYLAAKGTAAVGLKPVASGFADVDGELRNEDIDALMAASGVKLDLDDINLYRFTPAIAPHIAATEAGVSISTDLIASQLARAQAQADVVLVEGVGGWLVPLNTPKPSSDCARAAKPCATIETLAEHLELPVILVVGMRLGCLNHALLTVQAIESSGCHLLGWVANHIDPRMEKQKDNLGTLKSLISAPLLFEMPYFSEQKKMREFTPKIAN